MSEKRAEWPWKNAPGAPIDQEGDYWAFEDATTYCSGEIEVVPHDGYWSAMVRLEIDAGSVLPHDARALGKALIEAAERADALNDAATQAVAESQRRMAA